MNGLLAFVPDTLTMVSNKAWAAAVHHHRNPPMVRLTKINFNGKLSRHR